MAKNEDSGNYLRMRRRRPSFALVLVSLLAVVIGAFALLGTGPLRFGAPRASGSAPQRDCETAQATVTETARQTVRAVARAQAPVTVIEQAQADGVVVVARRSSTVVAHAEVVEPLVVRRAATVNRRACATGETLQAAKGHALTLAYRSAVKAARAQAAAQAALEAGGLAAQVRPGELTKARSLAIAHAVSAARAERQRLQRSLAADARAQALRRSSGEAVQGARRSQAARVRAVRGTARSRTA